MAPASYRGPELLRSDHVVTGFDCCDLALNAWLTGRAIGNQSTGKSRTWAVTDAGAGRVVAFYACSTASVLRLAPPGGGDESLREELGAVVLSRLAVDAEHQGLGLGGALLRHFVLSATKLATATGVRLLLVHAAQRPAREFYQHHGFVASPVDASTLVMALAPSAVGADTLRA